MIPDRIRRRETSTASLFRGLAVLALTLFCAQTDAAAQDRPAVSVQSITVDGKPVDTVNGVRVTDPGGSRAEQRELRENDPLAPGTVIAVPDRTVVTLVTANGTVITLEAGSRTKINAVSDNGESFTSIFGEAWFKVVRALNFFEVAQDRFLAAVKGTEFKVAVDEREIQFNWLSGLIEVSRDVKVTIDGAAQRDVVTLTEDVSAENQRVRYQLNVDEYLRDFNSYRDVEEYFRSQAAEDERSGDQSRMLQGWTNLGTALVTIGKAREAIGYHARSLALHLQLYPDGVHPAIAADYEKLGIAYGDSGDPRSAIDSYERSLRLLLQLYPDGLRREIAVNYTNLGVEYGKTGDPRQAIDYYERSLELLPKLYPDANGVHPGIAANLGNLGVEYGKLKEPRKAIDYFDRSLALHRQLHPTGVHPDIAVDYVNLGVQYLYLGELRKAIDSYDQSLALLLQLYPNGVHPSIAVVYRNLESAWRAAGDAARADDYASKEKDTAAKLKP